MNILAEGAHLAAVSGDPHTFAQEFKKFAETKEILEYHISGQPVQMPNPNYRGTFGIIAGQPEIINTIVITAIIIYKNKPDEKKTLDLIN